MRAAGDGEETEVAMNDFVEIGVFGADDGGGAFAGEYQRRTKFGNVLHLQKHRVRSGQQRITVTVVGEPSRAGIDPHLKLIDRDWEDNTRAVEMN